MTLFQEENVLIDVPLKNRKAIELALAFPNTYSIGIASVGFQTAWKLFNQSEDINITRWFTDIEENSVTTPSWVGFSFSWELDYKNIFQILEKNNIPLHIKDRGENDPITFAGGVVPNANPAPFYDNFDFFLIGDLEVVATPLIKKIIEIRTLKREEKLNEIEGLPGVYIPRRRGSGTPPSGRKITHGNLSFSSILTPNSIWPNTFIMEVVRSCPELCRFCLASYGSLPFRTPDLKESLIPIIDFGLKHTHKIGLMGPSITQHPEFEELIEYLLSVVVETQLIASLPRVQIASVRADTISKNLAKGLYKLGIKSITMAVETGSERLRNFINKKVSNETIFNSIKTIHDAGINSIKLYGMVGLPDETQEDLNETIEFLKNLKRATGNLRVAWGCSIFVPKIGTPFQWYGTDTNVDKKFKFLSKELHQIGIEFRPESFKWAQIQALISRGDGSINKALEKAYRYGSTLGAFNKAIKECNINKDHFVFKTWDKSEGFSKNENPERQKGKGKITI